MPHVEVRTSGGRKRYRIKGVGTFDTKREALQAWATDTKPSTDERTWDDLIVTFLAEYERTRKFSSFQTARYRLNRFAQVFGQRLASVPITRAEAERYAAQHRTDEITVLMNWAVEHDVIDKNPFRGLTRRSRGRRDQDPPTVQEVDLLASKAREVYGEAHRALVLFAAYSGLRKGELLGLRWTDIDFDGNRVQVNRRVYRGATDLPKSNRRRLSALLPEARDALQPLPRLSARVFPWSETGLDSWWKTVRDVAGLTTTLHELRHFNGHYLYVHLDLPSRVVAAHLGHSSPRLVEELYGHFKVGALEEIDRAVGKVEPLAPRLRKVEGR